MNSAAAQTRPNFRIEHLVNRVRRECRSIHSTCHPSRIFLRRFAIGVDLRASKASPGATYVAEREDSNGHPIMSPSGEVGVTIGHTSDDEHVDLERRANASANRARSARLAEITR
jgi:hypothetical protein